MDEKVLWKLIKQNDDKALQMLFDLHYKPMCYYAIQFVKQMPEAEDIVQSVFIKLWTKRHNITINTSLKSYLYRSVYNNYIDEFRKDKQKEKYLESLKYDMLTEHIDIEDSSEFQEKIDRIKTLVDTLSPRCKEVLLLSKQEGYKHREIAEKLEISVKTVESLMSTAFKKIRAGFEDGDLFFILIRKVFKRLKF
ncbi:RNA polymerase sigma factor [Flavivirga spongiicola]|uniref:RNA polymerase sigma-70 factor n=1 Tax=Flavivirga spongiicola TaxID=421621 RepID=A0ABU7XUQ4_9FLAO|nr:RNA polymerase sigma-70 factor [Flavivirga sp. MEBiC05379]MDO5979509.1 RNA polymerase sigma-70 factor [Flavivirga sp. MEBiC05379]